MKEAKPEQAPASDNWIEKTRRLLSVPKAEIDRREAAFRRRRRLKRRAT